MVSVPVVVVVVDLPERGEHHPGSGENQGLPQGSRSGRHPVEAGGRGQSRYLRPTDQGRAGTGEQARSQGGGRRTVDTDPPWHAGLLGQGAERRRLILPGNRVDVLLSLGEISGTNATGGGNTITLLQNVEILAVDQKMDGPLGQQG